MQKVKGHKHWSQFVTCYNCLKVFQITFLKNLTIKTIPKIQEYY